MPTPKKWYLNLQPDAQNKNRGTTVDLVATRKFGHSPKATLRTVSWAVQRDLRGLDDSLLPADAGTLEHPQTTEELADRRFKNKLRTGPATNVLYTVTAQKAAAQGKANVAFNQQYETVRQVYYDVVYMHGLKPVWTAIKERFKAAWAAVGYEFVEGNVTEALRDEAVSDIGPDVLLKRLYRNPNVNLPHHPYHVRIVIAKDLASSDAIKADWRIDETTQKGTGLTRVWSTGDVVHYESPIQVMEQDPANGIVRTITSVDVPGGAIARIDDHTIHIDLNDVALDGPRDALAAGRKVSLKAKLKASVAKELSLSIKLDHRSKAAPIRAGSTTITVAAAGPGATTITVRDDARTFIAQPVRDAKIDRKDHDRQAQEKYRDGGTVDLVGATVRTSDHVLTITVPDQQGVPAILTAGGPTEMAVNLRLAGEQGPKARTLVAKLTLTLKLLYGGADAEDAVDSEVKAGTMVTYDAAGPRIVVTDEKRVFDLATPLVDPSLLYAGADVAIPAAAATRNAGNPKQVDFNLAYAGLAGPLGVWQAGGVLEFKADLQAMQSTGGYSPTNNRNFLALTTKKMKPDETAETTQNRALMCALHELGHAHGLVHGQSSYGGATATNAKSYTNDQGGNGTHCSHNAKLVPSGPSYGELPTSSGQVFVHAGGGKLCIMYHRLDVANMDTKFCDACAAHLRMSSMVSF